MALDRQGQKVLQKCNLMSFQTVKPAISRANATIWVWSVFKRVESVILRLNYLPFCQIPLSIPPYQLKRPLQALILADRPCSESAGYTIRYFGLYTMLPFVWL